jgi:homoserine O-acetyltransferase/O-succinyltransferase
VWVFHALTANSDPAEWWDGLVGEGKLFDPAQYFIVCVNMPGGCYGSIGPLDINPDTGQPWYHDFPFFTPRDMVRAYQPLRQHLGIRSVYLGIGGSMGGQQLLEWAVEEPGLFRYIVPMATNAQHSPWGIAFNASQRMAIEADTTWPQRHPQAGIEGMRAARSVALLSYRHYLAYGQTQAETDTALLEGFRAEGYQRHQGEKLVRRFNAFSYYYLSKGMDSHHLGRGRGSVAQALQTISARVLVIGIETDMLFPVSEQRFIHEQIPGSEYVVIQSPFGHDGFLVEYAAIEQCLRAFLTPFHPRIDATDSKEIWEQAQSIN